MKTSNLQSVMQARLPGESSLRISARHRIRCQFGPEEYRAIVREIVRQFTKNTPQLTRLLVNALKDLSRRCNKSDGGAHPWDRNRIKETFLLLHKAGVILGKVEVASWLEYYGWPGKHAIRLGQIAQEIGEGKKPVIKHGPFYHDDIIHYWMNGA